MNLVLPPDFNALYTFCNGFEDDDLFRLIPLEEILERKHRYQPGQFEVAEYMIYGEVWEVEINSPLATDYLLFTSRYNQRLNLTSSLTEFIERFLQGGVWQANGLVQWFEDLRKKKS